ncbi:phosphoglycerate kinase [Mycoplasmoides gallisepticum]|uniref:Phosphoglycerate kinase n=1 Tax=Mycoplasmoides gallisepticum TaxID=2096 RepID=A0AB36DSA7_MYCGL|nr:phosphoglycerate kinase [Mycoplasmoides gallisepticum]OBU78706.1 phosphoglycerate kinase [Mycoplasmoides gallisepticum]OBU79103.1 phosphoglycerate kinase [Mycoplasmoides gallisepticum]OBU80450.1 phosphoglycerate kinase [Mycoplasmoides gallisepticum]OBU80673.1 phosphoglycerate kinase [Mycoplasmoides gallisepticum]OBU81417.1 phosphoglycerate kinase [Mycoplasmoides gallisepticum]
MINYNKKTLKDVDLKDKTVIVRVDFNVPIKDNKVIDDTRIVQALDTIKYLIEQNCKIVLLSHLSRIKSLEDISSKKKSLRPVYENLKTKLNNIKFLEENVGYDVVEAVKQLKHKEVLLLENTRYNDVDNQGEVVKKESKNSPELGRFWASLADVFVNDAFGTSHRAHASNVGIAANISQSCIGFLVQKELEALSKLTNNPQRPFVVILGGAKVSDKLKVIESLLKSADQILIGGGMVNTFNKAKGYHIGKSLFEPEMLETAKKILAEDKDNKIILATDQMVTKASTITDIKTAPAGKCVFAKDEAENEDFEALDIGDESIKTFKSYIAKAKSIFWNGPLGVFENPNYERGSYEIAKAISESDSYSVIGGGDSAAAANQFKLADKFSFVSTGGGASLTFMEQTVLPGIEAIQSK